MFLPPTPKLEWAIRNVRRSQHILASVCSLSFSTACVINNHSLSWPNTVSDHSLFDYLLVLVLFLCFYHKQEGLIVIADYWLCWDLSPLNKYIFCTDHKISLLFSHRVTCRPNLQTILNVKKVEEPSFTCNMSQFDLWKILGTTGPGANNTCKIPKPNSTAILTI